MEPNNKKKSIISVFIVLGLILLAVMCWMIFQKGREQNIIQAQQVAKETKAVFSQANIIFPKILSLTPLALKDVPVDIQIFGVSGAVEQKYNTIQYENKKTGFSFSYVLPNTTIKQFLLELPKQLESDKNKSPWIKQGNTNTDTVGYLEFLNNVSKNQARVTFFQQDKDMKIVVQSINAK
jgi:hypothetical protein